jgi:hypothetical protein
MYPISPDQGLVILKASPGNDGLFPAEGLWGGSSERQCFLAPEASRSFFLWPTEVSPVGLQWD